LAAGKTARAAVESARPVSMETAFAAERFALDLDIFKLIARPEAGTANYNHYPLASRQMFVEKIISSQKNILKFGAKKCQYQRGSMFRRAIPCSFF
jgi:hypothetical protein